MENTKPKLPRRPFAEELISSDLNTASDWFSAFVHHANLANIPKHFQHISQAGLFAKIKKKFYTLKEII
jgi:hypothetical protein